MASAPSITEPVPLDIVNTFKSSFPPQLDLSNQFNGTPKSFKAMGGYADIYLTQWKDPSSGQRIDVCYKVLRTILINPPDSKKPNSVSKYLARELTVWKDLEHPSIVKLIGYDIDIGDPPRGVLVSKWYPNGNIKSYLGKHPDTDDARRRQMVRGIAEGLCYLHTGTPEVVVHGDISPNNVLVTDELQAVLTDFGLSRIIHEVTDSQNSAISGFTARYTAHEVLRSGKCSPESDIYSFGCTCIEILHSERPFARHSLMLQVSFAAMSGEAPWARSFGSSLLDRMLSQCCDRDEDKRPSIRDIIEEFGY